MTLQTTEPLAAGPRGGRRAPARRGAPMPLLAPTLALAALLAPALALLLGLLAPGGADAQGYAVRSGDVLRIEVVEDPDLTRTVLVTPDGTITFPFAGEIDARGRSVGQIREAIVAGLSGVFAAGTPPTVFVSIERLAPVEPSLPALDVPLEAPVIDVFITGEIASPGLIPVTPGTTILQLIAQAGGLSRFAAEDRIVLRRTDPALGTTIDYRFDFDGGSASISPATVLAPGDVVVVPERRLFEF